MQIVYQEINVGLLEKVGVKYGEMAKKHIHIGQDSYSIVAVCDDIPIGFISTYPFEEAFARLIRHEGAKRNGRWVVL